MGKNNFLPKCLFLLKNDFWTMLFFIFFPYQVSGVGGFWKVWKIPYFILKASLMVQFQKKNYLIDTSPSWVCGVSRSQMENSVLFFCTLPLPYLISHMRQILKYTLLEAFDNTQLEAEQLVRSCKRRKILLQKSSLLFLTWREYFYSQPTHSPSQPKK